VVDSRVAQNIKIMTEANSLPQTPTVGAVFDRRFLPPASDRIKHF
jgi:hypothetical protein